MNTPVTIIREEIQRQGVMSFARFMELALYCPETGYYEAKKDSVGRHGDFYTSVSVGSLFGELLAFQFAEWIKELLRVNVAGSKIQIIEAGAHDGKLAADVLNWLRAHRPKLFSEMEYVIVEPSAHRRNWQKKTLAEFGNKISWVENIAGLKNWQLVNGIIFSNELLDAFPVQRFGWNATKKKWFEWAVALEGEKFTWAKLNSEFRIPNSELETVLPDNYTIEISPAAENWWRDAAGILESGWLMTIDYGLTTEEIFSPARTNGTLRAYFDHRASSDVLANAGEQDITAHVDFSAIRKVGEAAGLITEFFDTQYKFLTEILGKAARNNSIGELMPREPGEGAGNSNRMRQFQTLTHPEHLGRAFRALVQSR